MIIDSTVVFNFVHEAWDVMGLILFGLLAVFMPLALVVASIIKIGEARKSKLETKGDK